MVKAAAPYLFQIALASDPISPDAYRASYSAIEASPLEVAVHAAPAAAFLPVAFEPGCRNQLGT